MPQLLSLNETSLALLGTFLTVTLETENSEESGEGEAARRIMPGLGGGAGQSVFGLTRSSTILESLAGAPSDITRYQSARHVVLGAIRHGR